MDEIEFVADNFETSKDFGRIRKGYCYSKIKSHLFFFKRIENSDLEVVRILHERMDVINRIND
jgi:toxin ParE1/3/4